jgi:glycine C-acetyltransferase
MFEHAAKLYQSALDEIVAAGLYKDERVLTTPQGAHIRTNENVGRGDVLNFCANNYLGLSSHPRLIEAAKRSLDTYGFGLSSVRFICGTQTF